jgi:hypothetical protein
VSEDLPVRRHLPESDVGVDHLAQPAEMLGRGVLGRVEPAPEVVAGLVAALVAGGAVAAAEERATCDSMVSSRLCWSPSPW